MAACFGLRVGKTEQVLVVVDIQILNVSKENQKMSETVN